MMVRASPVTLVGFGATRGLVRQHQQHHYHMMIVVQLVPCFVVHIVADVAVVADVVVDVVGDGDGGGDDGASGWVRTVNDGIGSQSMMVPVVVVDVVDFVDFVVDDDVVRECSVVDDDRWDTAELVVVSAWVSPW
mgnify:CR=1 FL=1